MKKQLLLSLLFVVPIYAFSPHPVECGYVYSVNKYNNVYLEKKERITRIMNTIAYQETRNKDNIQGGSGELGMFQIMPATWKNWCNMYFGKPKPMTRKNQLLIVELVITHWVMQGLSLKQIAAKWNCGTHIGWENKIGINSYGVQYNVPAYVSHFVYQYNKIKNIKS
jgi:hypothetical protein